MNQLSFFLRLPSLHQEGEEKVEESEKGERKGNAAKDEGMVGRGGGEIGGKRRKGTNNRGAMN